MQVVIEVNAKDAIAYLGEIETRSLIPLLDYFGPILAEHERQHIADREGPVGPFPELTPQYAKWKQRNYAGQPMLHLTDAMYDAIGFEVFEFYNMVVAGVQGIPYAPAVAGRRDFGWIDQRLVDETLEPVTTNFILTGDISGTVLG